MCRKIGFGLFVDSFLFLSLLNFFKEIPGVDWDILLGLQWSILLTLLHHKGFAQGPWPAGVCKYLQKQNKPPTGI